MTNNQHSITGTTIVISISNECPKEYIQDVTNLIYNNFGGFVNVMICDSTNNNDNALMKQAMHWMERALKAEQNKAQPAPVNDSWIEIDSIAQAGLNMSIRKHS